MKFINKVTSNFVEARYWYHQQQLCYCKILHNGSHTATADGR